MLLVLKVAPVKRTESISWQDPKCMTKRETKQDVSKVPRGLRCAHESRLSDVCRARLGWEVGGQGFENRSKLTTERHKEGDFGFHELSMKQVRSGERLQQSHYRIQKGKEIEEKSRESRLDPSAVPVGRCECLAWPGKRARGGPV